MKLSLALVLLLSGCATPPAIILHHNNQDFDGSTICNCIMIKHECSNDISLIEHEMTHVKQFYRTFGLHPILYSLNQKYKLNSEVEAYKVQIAVNRANTDLYDIEKCIRSYAKSLSTDYGFNISYQEALRLILADQIDAEGTSQ